MSASATHCGHNYTGSLPVFYHVTQNPNFIPNPQCNRKCVEILEPILFGCWYYYILMYVCGAILLDHGVGTFIRRWRRQLAWNAWSGKLLSIHSLSI